MRLSFLPGEGSESDLIGLLGERRNKMVFLVPDYGGVTFEPVPPAEGPHDAHDVLYFPRVSTEQSLYRVTQTQFLSI